MNRNKKDYPVEVKINGDMVQIHISLDDIIAATYGLSDEAYIALVTETSANYSYLVHRSIARKLDLENENKNG